MTAWGAQIGASGGCRVTQSDLSLYVLEEFLCHDVTHAFGGTARAGMLRVAFQIVPVIEGDFLANANRPGRDQPNLPCDALCLTVGRTTVVHEPRRIFGDVAVQIPLIIETKNKPVVLFATAPGLSLVDSLPDVFKYQS